MKKYEFTGETKEIRLLSRTATLHRIRATVTFGIVEAGDLGGWIEKEEILSHEGKAWVWGNAEVCGDAKVCGNATVYGNAKDCGNAKVCGDATVYGDAKVCGNAEVCGNAKVYGDATVYGDANILCVENRKSGGGKKSCAIGMRNDINFLQISFLLYLLYLFYLEIFLL